MARLAEKLDKLVAAHEDKKLAVVVNFLGEANDRTRKKIYNFGEKHDLQKVPLALTTDGDAFKINDRAAVTVMIYRGKKVNANYALPEGGLDLRTVAKIIKSTKKMLREPAEEPKAREKAVPSDEPKEQAAEDSP